MQPEYIFVMARNSWQKKRLEGSCSSKDFNSVVYRLYINLIDRLDKRHHESRHHDS